jgi:citronellol/citronellal dehydrogenase
VPAGLGALLRRLFERTCFYHRGVDAVLRQGCLAGRSALVTGGGSGIGRATAELLAELGARVSVAGRRAEMLEQTASAVRAQGGECMPVVCDVREPEAARELVDRVMQAHGSLDVLVNNAGGQFVAPAEDISLKGFRAVTRLNLDAVWELIRLVAVESMLPNGYGKIVSVVLSPRRGIPGMFHSSAARAAVESMTRTLATEWGGRGVRLTCVAPGTIDTEGWRGYGETPEDAAARIPLGRLGTPGEVAQMIAFLVSPAGDFVTGTTVVIDGGVDNVDLRPGRRP